MLLLAQQKLDEINRVGGGRKSAVSSHLLSTLLYVALMAYKVEDMKAMLQEEDDFMYDEWKGLFDSLHSPEFHANERIIQNKRVKSSFERKRRYKEEASRLQKELTHASNKLEELQKLSNETCHQMSRTVNLLQDERAALVAKDKERLCQIDELKEQIRGLQLEQNESTTKDDMIEKLSKHLKENELDLAVANEKASSNEAALKEAKAALESNVTKQANYRLEKEASMSKLQQELVELESRITVVTAQLALTDESLDAAKQSLDDNKKSIETKVDSLCEAMKTVLDEINSESASIKDSVSAMSSDLSQTKSLLFESTDQRIKVDDTLNDVVSKINDLSNAIETVRVHGNGTNSAPPASFRPQMMYVSTTAEFDEMCTQTLQRIAGNINDVCTMCYDMEDTIHHSKQRNDASEFDTNLLERLGSKIRDVSAQCAYIKSDVATAMGGMKIASILSQVERSRETEEKPLEPTFNTTEDTGDVSMDEALQLELPLDPVASATNTPPAHESLSDRPMSAGSTSTARDLVDNCVSEAMSTVIP